LYLIFYSFFFTYPDIEGKEWMMIVVGKEIKTIKKNQEKKLKS